MPVPLLPNSAKAFAPRSAPVIVPHVPIPKWLRQTLKHIKTRRHPLNNDSQRVQFLTATLGASSAIWTLCSLLLPNAPSMDLRYQLVTVEAYVVSVEIAAKKETVDFKLTPETIERLVEYHTHIYCIDATANTPSWSKESQLKKMQTTFEQTINEFVLRTKAVALEEVEADGTGELIGKRSANVRDAIMKLFLPLVEPHHPIQPLPKEVSLCSDARTEDANDRTELRFLAHHNPSLYDLWCSFSLYLPRDNYDMCPAQDPPTTGHDLVKLTIAGDLKRQVDERAFGARAAQKAVGTEALYNASVDFGAKRMTAGYTRGDSSGCWMLH